MSSLSSDMVRIYLQEIGRQIQVKAISILRHHQNDIQEYLFD